MSSASTIHERGHAATQKYDYFVCGLAMAMFAYIGKDFYVVHPINLYEKFTISALACYALSVCSGLLGIYSFNIATRLNERVLVCGESARNCLSVILRHKADDSVPIMNDATGKESSIKVVKAKFKKFRTQQKQFRKEMRGSFVFSTVCNLFCHLFLFCGFILIIWSKFSVESPST